MALRDEVRAALATAGELLELRDGRQFFGKTTRKWLAALCDENERLERERVEQVTALGVKLAQLERKRHAAQEAANSLHASHAAALVAIEAEREAKSDLDAMLEHHKAVDDAYVSLKAQHAKDVKAAYREAFDEAKDYITGDGERDLWADAAWLASEAKRRLEER